LMLTIACGYFEKYAKGLSNPLEGVTDPRNGAAQNHHKLMREAHNKAFKSAREAWALAKKADNRELQANALLKVAQIQMIGGRYKEAMEARDEALQLFQQLGLKREESITTTLGAEVQFGLKEIDEATALAETGLELARAVKDGVAENYAIEVLNVIYTSLAKPAPVVQEQVATAVAALPMSGAGAIAPAANEPKGLDPDMVREKIANVAGEVVGVDDGLYNDSPLMESGMDSLSAVQFRNILTRTLEGISMPASLMFDYPSINQITEYVVEESKRK